MDDSKEIPIVLLLELLLFPSQTGEQVIVFTLSLLLNSVMPPSTNKYVTIIFLMFKSVSGI
jgi:hypothetical protein